MNISELILNITLVFLLLYLIISIKLFISLNRLKYHPETNTRRVSIVVSLHNEEKNVNQLINCLVNQEYPSELFEIILVNDRSTDGTEQLLEIAAKSYKNIKTININKTDDEFAPKKYAIDKAIIEATGEIVLLTDADGRPGSGWIKAMLSYFSDKTGLVIGNAPYIAEKFIQKLLQMEYFSHSTIAAASVGMGYPLTCVGTNMAYRKGIYLEIDGFGEFKNVHSGDDDLFLLRVRDKTDWEIRYATANESQVHNAPPDSLKQFVNQRIRYASKGFKYPAKVTVSLISYYLFNVFIFLSAILSFINTPLLSTLLFVILTKAIMDFILIKKSAKRLNTKIHFIVFPIVNILHIPYVIFFGLMGNIKKYKWAGIKN